MSKRIPFIYVCILLIGAVLITLSFFQTPTPPEDTSANIIEPTVTNQISKYEREFIFDVEEIDIYKKDFVFFTGHEYVKVYADDVLVYENTDDGGIWGHTTGSVWNFVTVPYDARNVKIVLTASYDSVANDVPIFRTGDTLSLYKSILVDSLPSLALGMLIIIIGVGLIIYWLFLTRNTNITKSLLYLGIFALLFGLWSLNETNGATLFINHRISSSFMAYILLMLLSSSCILFIKEFLVNADNIIWKILCVANCIEFFAVFILQCLDIVDMKETLFVTHILFFVTLFYLLGILIYQLVKKKYSRALKSYLTAIIILFFSTLADVITYYNKSFEADSNVIGRFGFIVFILILAKEAASSSLDLIEKGKKAKIYEELAITDMLTGIKNRNAYISDINNFDSYNNIMIITFDLNNLKQCNDTKGHTEGDNYILSATRIIERTFSKYGSCYRIGGDEFCVIVQDALNCPIKSLLSELGMAEGEFNASKTFKFEMHIACGYAIFNPETDKNLESTRDRADIMMYENKSFIKSSN